MPDRKNNREAIEPDDESKRDSAVEFYHYGEEPPGTPPVMPEDIGDKIFKEPGTPSRPEKEKRK